VKITVTSRTKYRVFSTAIYAIGVQSWLLAATGNMPGAVVLLLIALAFNAAREHAFALEVRGYGDLTTSPPVL
jgi:hypothetical protein